MLHQKLHSWHGPIMITFICWNPGEIRLASGLLQLRAVDDQLAGEKNYCSKEYMQKQRAIISSKGIPK